MTGHNYPPQNLSEQTGQTPASPDLASWGRFDSSNGFEPAARIPGPRIYDRAWEPASPFDGTQHGQTTQPHEAPTIGLGLDETQFIDPDFQKKNALIKAQALAEQNERYAELDRSRVAMRTAFPERSEMSGEHLTGEGRRQLRVVLNAGSIAAGEMTTKVTLPAHSGSVSHEGQYRPGFQSRHGGQS